MNLSTFTAYLQAYLQTNDPNVINNIPNFVQLACTRIGAQLRVGLTEVVATFPGAQQITLPPDFLALRSANVGGPALIWKSPDALTDMIAAQAITQVPIAPFLEPTWYTIVAGTMRLWPAPSATQTLSLLYLAQDPNAPTAVLAGLPHMLLRAASFEAQMYQGDGESALAENVLYKQALEGAQGWDMPVGLTIGGC